MPKVAVIGTGPSGLAAAKALAEHGIEPVVLEAGLNIGGMWAGKGRGAWASDMRTNLSYHSCAFSDFPWPPGTEDFPIRSEVVRYLTAYAAEFSLLRFIQFGVRVAAIRPAGAQWRLDMLHNGAPETDVFDHVIVTTGFFSRPYMPPFEGIDRFTGAVLHSADTDSPAAHREDFAGKRVLVIGPAFSGIEITARIVPIAAELTVSLRHPMWFIPRMIRPEPGAPLYPYDLVFYDRSPDNRLLRHPEIFLRELGGDPGDTSPELAFPPDQDPPLDIIVSDQFLRLVGEGRVNVKRSATLRFDETGVIFADGARRDLDTVVACTGYTTELPLFDAEIQRILAFDPDDRLEPVLLHKNVFHPDLPGLSFVGFYRGPYFPIMELQSRWIARILSGEQPPPTDAAMREGIEDARRIREANPRPQFPHGDFVGHADSLAREIGALPTLPETDPIAPYLARGPVIAAQFRLCGPHAKPDLAASIIRATPAPRLGLPTPARTEPRDAIAPALRVMRLLAGNWSIARTIEPGGAFTGHARFTPQSNDKLLYEESGTLRLADGREMEGSNSYLYTRRDHTIEVTFAEGPSAGTHFVDIAFPPQAKPGERLHSADTHLCRLDQYDTIFDFESDNRFTVTYVVCGPRKGYVMRSVFERAA